jgi:hypothetical protein
MDDESVEKIKELLIQGLVSDDIADSFNDAVTHKQRDIYTRNYRASVMTDSSRKFNTKAIICIRTYLKCVDL